MAELLLELFSEEIPARMQARAAEDLRRLASDALEEAGDIALHRHIYIDAKPDRYEFADDRPRITEAELMAELGIPEGGG